MIGDISSYFVSTYFPVQTAKNNILYNGRKKIEPLLVNKHYESGVSFRKVTQEILLSSWLSPSYKVV